jgi:hypothetical protein
MSELNVMTNVGKLVVVNIAPPQLIGHASVGPAQVPMIEPPHGDVWHVNGVGEDELLPQLIATHAPRTSQSRVGMVPLYQQMTCHP